MIQSLALFSIFKKSKVAREKVSTVKIEFGSHNPPIIICPPRQQLSENKYYLFLDILNSFDLAKLTTWRGRLIFHRKNFNRINNLQHTLTTQNKNDKFHLMKFITSAKSKGQSLARFLMPFLKCHIAKFFVACSFSQVSISI